MRFSEFSKTVKLKMEAQEGGLKMNIKAKDRKGNIAVRLEDKACVAAEYTCDIWGLFSKAFFCFEAYQMDLVADLITGLLADKRKLKK